MAGLMSAGRQLASKGRMGDSILAHINPREAALLMAHGGMGTRNPKTGLMEFWSWDDWLRMFGGGEGGDYTQTTTPTDSTPTDTTPADTTPTAPASKTETTSDPNDGWTSSGSGDGSRTSLAGDYKTIPISSDSSIGKDLVGADGDTHYKVNYDYYSPELGNPTVSISDAAGTDYSSLLPTGWDADAYKKANEDVDWDSGIDPLEHYLNTGKAQGLGWGKNNKYSPTYDPDYQYSWQSDQDWAVPGRQKDTSYNVNIGSGDSVATDDPYETQRDESGKPIASNYKYYQQGDDLYGANVTKVYEDPNKWYSDMDKDTLSGLSLYYTDDGKYYYEDKDKNKYDITFGDGATSGTVKIGDKTYNIHKGNEETFSYKMPTTEELQASDYTGKYDTTTATTTGSDYSVVPIYEWEDIGHGWKQRKDDSGETYFAMPGDDTTSRGYKGLTYDQIANWYTADGKNYSSDQIAWGKDPESDDYYIPMYMSAETSATPEGGGDTEKTLTFQRKLRPGEENDRDVVLNVVKSVLPTAVNALMSYGIGSGIVGELAGEAGSGLLSGATESALPSFTEGLSSIWDKVSSIPSSISNAASNFSLNSLAPSSLKSVAVPAAIGGGLRGVQTDWDIKEMLKGAGYGALTGYGLDRLGALWDYATTPSTTGPDSFSGGGASFEGVDSWTANHPSELLANQGLDTKFGIPVTDGVSYDPTLVTDRPIYAGDNGKFYLDNFDFPNVTEKWITENTPFYATDTPPIQKPIYQGADGKFYLDNWDFPNITEEWITNNTPFYNMNGEWYMDNFDNPNYSPELVEGGGREWMMDNFDNPEYSVEDPFGKNWKIDWDQYNGGPVGLESEGILGSISKYLPSAATLGTVAKGIIAGSGSGSGDGSGSGGLDLSDLTGGGLMELFTTNPYAKRNKYKRAIQLAAQKSGMTVQEYLAANPKLQTYYYGLA